jgi:hypothetical protein
VELETLELLSEEVLKLTLNLLDHVDSLLAELRDVLLDGLNGVLDRLLADGVATSLDDGREVADTTTVPGKDVGSVGRNVGESVLGGNGKKVSLELLGGDLGDCVRGVDSGLHGKKVRKETSNVRRSHGGSGNGVDSVLAASPGGENVETRGEDVVALSEVGEVRTLILQVGGTDSLREALVDVT